MKCCYVCDTFLPTGARICPQCGAAVRPAAPALVVEASAPAAAPPTTQPARPAPVMSIPPEPIIKPKPAAVQRYRANPPAPISVAYADKETKSVSLAVLLTFFLGPLGMLYSTFGGAVTMFLINLIMLVVTSGQVFLLTWPICIMWGAVAASEHNQRLVTGSRR